MTLPDVALLEVALLEQALLEVALPSLRRCSAELLEIADELRVDLAAGSPAVALADSAAAVAAGGLVVAADAALTDLATRLQGAGTALRMAADGYEAADERCVARLGRRSEW